MALVIKRLSEKAILPKRGSALAAGYDLSSAHETVIPARGKGIVKTDLAMVIPNGCYGRIAPRSGLAWKRHIDVGAGVIDADYRGNVGVVLFNHGAEDLEVKPGDRVAQLILERYAVFPVEEVEAGQELPSSDRGAGGFGSTGVSKMTDDDKPTSSSQTATTTADADADIGAADADIGAAGAAAADADIGAADAAAADAAGGKVSAKRPRT